MHDVTFQTIANFQVRYLTFIDHQARATQKLPDFYSPSVLLFFYKHMVWSRILDKQAICLQRTGRLGGYASCQGQEATSTGLGYALTHHDVFAPHYRDLPALLLRGNSLREIFAIWGGDEMAGRYANPATQEDLPTLIPIASQCLHATGIAKAIQYRNENRAVLCVCGDGGTSKGDFYTALNVSGAWKLPVVFVINNNQWAISVGRHQQTAAHSLAQKAIAAGFEGIQVDGNDAVAVHYAVDYALKQARLGHGPSLIEAVTYRLSDHTTADDATRYQPVHEVQNAWKEEPILRLNRYLQAQNWWSAEQESELYEILRVQAQDAFDAMWDADYPKPSDFFDYMYAQWPVALKNQYDECGLSL